MIRNEHIQNQIRNCGGLRMTDKERLEDIKNSHLRGLHSLFGTHWVSIPKENFDWLIQQSERVQELEEENKRYREAIERALDESGWGDEGNALHKMISILAKALESDNE